MKIFFSFILLLSLTFNFYTYSYSQNNSYGLNNVNGEKDLAPTNPLYQLRVTNIVRGDETDNNENSLFFDIFIYHTNLFDSGPFEYAADQFYLKFNPSIANGGTLSYSIVPNSSDFTNPDAIPVNPTIVGGQLRLERNVNLDPGEGPIISTVFPGTKIVKMKLTTTAPEINANQMDLSWLISNINQQYSEVYAFVDSVSTFITGDGTFVIDTTEIPLPVELSGFTSNISANDVMLNWSTSSENNNYGFDIERSSVNNVWNKIGFVSGNGTSSSINNYLFEDKNLNSGKYKYRLRQVDYNGNYEYYNLTNEVVIGTPDKFSLKQNYPNPFNPSTKIEFDIPSDGFVSMKLYDINGREVKSLINEFRYSGYHTFEFNADGLSSGVYYYILNSGNFRSSKKLILVK